MRYLEYSGVDLSAGERVKVPTVSRYWRYVKRFHPPVPAVPQLEAGERLFHSSCSSCKST